MTIELSPSQPFEPAPEQTRTEKLIEERITLQRELGSAALEVAAANARYSQLIARTIQANADLHAEGIDPWPIIAKLQPASSLAIGIEAEELAS